MPTFQHLEQHGHLHLRTTDEELLVNDDYLKVMKIMHLWNTNVIQRGGGYCVSMSDMVRILLNQQGIECDLVECSLTVMSKNPPGLFLIGHSGQISNFHQEIDTHVVVITQTRIPVLIDLSVFGILPNSVPFVCERISKTGDILNLQLENSTWVYKRKDINKIPRMYQKSIMDRFKTDQYVQRSLTFLKIWIIIVSVVTTLNAIRGAYDFYHIHVKQDVQDVQEAAREAAREILENHK